MAKKEKRFEVIFEEASNITDSYRIVVDKNTGVNYILYASGYSGGITPLLDSEGKIVITKE
jgi:hypothetical protein